MCDLRDDFVYQGCIEALLTDFSNSNFKGFLKIQILTVL
jgi:hypothetical protein